MTYEDYMQKVNERARKRYADLRAKGLCSWCGKVETDGASMCKECARKHADYIKEQRHMRQANGICIRCGKINTGNYTMCFECRIKDAERKLRKKEVTA